MFENSETSDRQKTFLIIAGEQSGDTHGAGFIEALREKIPDCSIFGIGGDMMRKEGMDVLFSVDKMAILGIIEVMKHVPFIRKVFKTLVREVRIRKPTAVILIDYPDFNIRLAKKIRRHGYSSTKIFYYVSPQVWAWRKNRIKTIARYVDCMAVVFQFEKELYTETGMRVEFVGHPLLDVVKPSMAKDAFYEKYGLELDQPLIGLLPGSRHQEIVRHLPVMLKAMRLVQEQVSDLRVVIGKARHIPDSVYHELLGTSHFSAVLTEDVYDCMHHCTLAVVSSGTATLETAIAGTPMVIVYKMSPLTHIIARRLVSLPYIGMVNIVHNKKIAPELIQNEVRPGRIFTEVMRLMSDMTLYEETKKTLAQTRFLLGEPGASRRAVDLLLEIVG